MGMGYRVCVVFVFVAATFTVALFFIIRRLKICDYILLLYCSTALLLFLRLHASPFTLHGFTLHAFTIFFTPSRLHAFTVFFTLHASRFTPSRFFSRFTASRFTLHASRKIKSPLPLFKKEGF